jgi:bleomycin hydrolase
VPNEIFGNNDSDGHYDTNKLIKNLEIIVKNTVKLFGKNSNNNWEKEIDLLLDNHFGKVPEKFIFEGNEFTPMSFYKSLGINNKDYVSLTSWGYKPHNTSFILSIPDNYLNHSFYNLKLDNYMSIAINALTKKNSIGIDMDISEPGFNSNKGFAILPASSTAENLTIHSDEKTVTVTERDQSFLTFHTVDDHLMHMVGFSKDEKGQLFYKIKNSWGKNNETQGFIMLSENYFKAKSISMILHKDGLPIAIKEVLGIN